MYFESFAKILYELEDGFHILKDISENVRFKKEVLENILVFDLYDMKEGETPEIVSEKLYGTAQYHWVLMVLNQKYDYITDFPLPQVELEKYITQKYGDGNEGDIHHYISEAGFICDSDFPGAASVSNTDYEYSVNESKRRIKVISLDLMVEVIKQFNSII